MSARAWQGLAALLLAVAGLAPLPAQDLAEEDIFSAEAFDQSVADSREQEQANKLEYLVVPMFYKRPREYAAVMRSAIALNGSYFNAQRMFLQYLQNAYLSAGNR